MKREFGEPPPASAGPPLSLTGLEQRAVDTAMRSAHRLHHPAYGRDDMRQEASVAVLLARVRLSVDYTEAEAEAFYARRAIGGVIDGLREVLRQDGIQRTKGSASVPGERYTRQIVFPSEPASESVAGDSPEGDAVVSQAMRAIARMPHPLPQLAFLSISGSSVSHIAGLLAIHPSRVSRLRDVLASKLRKFL